MYRSSSARVARRPFTGILGVACLLTLGACGSGPGSDVAARTAVTFEQQVASAPAEACSLLAEKTRSDLEKSEKKPCAQALPDVDLPAASALNQVDVYEQHARVILHDDVVFVARFRDGWKVTAAGCKAQPNDEPYDCELGG